MIKPLKFALPGRLKEAFLRYRYVALILAAGVVLLLLPDGKETRQTAQQPQGVDTAGQVEQLERKLEAALSKIDGAGEVDVVLTVHSGARQVLAQDSRLTGAGGDRSQTLDTVLVSKGGGQQEAIQLEEISPRYRGALVICAGGESAAVRLQISEAISALTGLGTDKIVICKGN